MSRAARLLLICLALCLAPLSLRAQDQRRYFDPELTLDTGGRTGSCDVLAFTNDGKSLLAVGDDRVVRSWPFAAGKLDVDQSQVLRWMIHREQRGAIYAMAFSPDEQQSRVVIGGNGVVDMTLVVLDRASGDVIHAWRPKSHHVDAFRREGARTDYPVRALAYSPSGKQVAVGTDNGSVWIWNPAEVTFRARTGASFLQPLPSVRWNRDGVVRFLGRHQGKEFNRIRLLRYLDDNTLISVSMDGQVRRWKLGGKGKPESKVIFEFKRLSDKPNLETRLSCVVASADGKWLAAGHELTTAPTVEVLDLEQLTSSRLSVAEEDDLIFSLAFSPDAKTLAVGLRVVPMKRSFNAVAAGKVVLCEVNGKDGRGTPGPTLTRSPDVMAYHPSGKYLAIAGGDDQEVTVWDVSKKKASKVSEAVGVGTGLWAVSLSKDNQMLGFKNKRDPDATSINEQATGDWQVFNLRNCRWADPDKFDPLKPVEKLEGWSLVTSMDPRKWQVVDPKGKKHTLPIDLGRDGHPCCYTFLKSGDQVRLAVGHLYGVSLFGLKAGEQPQRIRMFSGHGGDVTSVCPSADGKLLVTASTDQTIAAWRLSDWPTESELGASFEAKEDDKGKVLLHVKQVDPGSPAWEAGLLEGEEILACFIDVDRYRYDGRNLFPDEKPKPLDAPAFVEQLGKARPNVDHEFHVYRGKGKDRKVVAISTTVRQRPLWQFFPTRDGEWVLWRWRDYYYHCSTKGDRYVGWQMSRGPEERPEFYRADQFRKKFNDPDKVVQMVRDSRTAPEKVAVPEMQPPEVEVVAVSSLEPEADKDVVVEVRVRQRGDAFIAQPSRITLWVNDYVVKDLEFELQDRKEYSTKITIPYKTLRYGPNAVTAQAYNRAGNLEKDNSQVTVERKQKPGNKPGDRRLRGLMVGVSKYEDRALRLDYAASDAEKIHAAWKKRKPGDVYTDVDEKDVTLLLDEKATGENVMKALKKLQEDVKNRPDDTVVIFLSGHGNAAVDRKAGLQPQTWHFLCSDYVKNADETILKGEDLYKILTKMPCRKVILMDCCHSGANADVVRALTPVGIGPVILTSCRANEVAFEAEKYKSGLFTHALLEAMDEKFDELAGKERVMSAEKLHRHVSGKVPELVKVLEKEIREARRKRGETDDPITQRPDFHGGREKQQALVTPP